MAALPTHGLPTTHGVPSLRSPDDRRRLARCMAGLVLCGIGFGSFVGADLGLDPWDVFHKGLGHRIGLSIGTTAIVVGLVLLLVWIPLRERLGVGTVLNAITIGAVMNAVIPHLPHPHQPVAQWLMLIVGVALAGTGIGLYIGAGLGPGPRDGIMTALARRGPSIRVVRTGIEVSALVAGWLLGGTVGPGTVAVAVAIGPVAHVAVARLSLPSRGGVAEVAA